MNDLTKCLSQNKCVSKIKVKGGYAVKAYSEYYTEQGRFQEKRDNNNNILEIGVRTGESLKSWEEFFPDSMIYGVDINPACKKLESDRSKIFIGDQSDVSFLNQVTSNVNNFDIIIDDGSHDAFDIATSFDYLWGYLNPKGVYIFEDMHCTYTYISKATHKKQKMQRDQFEKWLFQKILDIHHKPEMQIEDICFIANGIIFRKR